VSAGDWRVERHLGSATSFHARDLPDPVRRTIWWFEVTSPAIALGSTQRVEAVRSDAALEAGVEVLRRRSGGGAVWLAPGAVTWVDVLLPATDPHWVDDVSQAALWLGRAWVDALGAVGVEGAEVHTGPMVRSAWSGVACFSGVAPGEVVVDGRKVVGIAQRRTRAGSRLQCAVVHQWDPRPLADLLDLSAGDREALVADLAASAAGIGPVDPATLVAALADALVQASFF